MTGVTLPDSLSSFFDIRLEYTKSLTEKSPIFSLDDLLEGLDLKKKDFKSNKVCEITTNILRIVHRLYKRYNHKFETPLKTESQGDFYYPVAHE